MSTLKVDNLQGSDGSPRYTARAWVNFNGTGTVAIRASGNVSSITDGGTGIYTINFTTALPSSDYAVASTGMGDTGMIITGIDGPTAGPADLKTTTQLRVRARNDAAAAADIAEAHFIIFL